MNCFCLFLFIFVCDFLFCFFVCLNYGFMYLIIYLSPVLHAVVVYSLFDLFIYLCIYYLFHFLASCSNFGKVCADFCCRLSNYLIGHVIHLRIISVS